MIRWLFFKYQAASWYLQQSRNEAYKLIGGIEIFMSLLTYFAVIGFKLNPWQAIALFSSLLVIAVIGGIILTRMGVVAYNNKLANKQNQELLTILNTVKRIERKMKTWSK